MWPALEQASHGAQCLQEGGYGEGVQCRVGMAAPSKLGAVLSSQGEGVLCWAGTATPSEEALEAERASHGAQCL